MTVEGETARGVGHGASFGFGLDAPSSGPFRVYDGEGRLLAVYRVEGRLAVPEVVLDAGSAGDPLRWGPLRPHGSAITIGVFDGVHRGHRKVLEELTARADSRPARYRGPHLRPSPSGGSGAGQGTRLLTSVEARLRLFEQLGVDIAGVLPFDEVRSMEAESFVEGVLVRALGARLVAVGTDFRFGHDRRGDVGC